MLPYLGTVEGMSAKLTVKTCGAWFWKLLYASESDVVVPPGFTLYQL